MNEKTPALSAPSHPQPFYRKPLKTSEHRSIPHRYYFVLSLHLAGKTLEEISELSGYQPNTICAILAKEEVIAVRQQLLRATSDEFEALFSEVVGVIRDCLKSKDERVQLEAAEKWFKAHGKYTPTSAGGLNITAEDVVVQILNQNKEVGGSEE